MRLKMRKQFTVDRRTVSSAARIPKTGENPSACKVRPTKCLTEKEVHSNVSPDRVNLGCGPYAPPGWLNVDGSWNAWFAHHKYLRRGLELVGVINASNQGVNWQVSPLVHDLRVSGPRPARFRGGVFE